MQTYVYYLKNASELTCCISLDVQKILIPQNYFNLYFNVEKKKHANGLKTYKGWKPLPGQVYYSEKCIRSLVL